MCSALLIVTKGEKYTLKGRKVYPLFMRGEFNHSKVYMFIFYITTSLRDVMSSSKREYMVYLCACRGRENDPNIFYYLGETP